MKRLALIVSVVVLSFCGLLAMADERETAPALQNVRLGVDAEGQTRIVVDLSDDPNFAVVPSREGGTHLQIQISNASLALVGDMPAAKGVVQSVTTTGGRTTISLTEDALPEKSFVLQPSDSVAHYRLVIDLQSVDARDFDQAIADALTNIATDVSAQAQASAATEETESANADDKQEAAQNPSEADTGPSAQAVADALALPEELRALATAEEIADEIAPVPVPSLSPARIMGRTTRSSTAGPITIVLDPGHGGKDPGSLGATGLLEKDITLDAATLLKDELTRRGYRVVLTRSGDSFLPLSERIEIARDRQADLFMSIHADSNPEPLARGATVYTLSDARSDQMAQNASSLGDFKVFDVETGQNDEVGRNVGSILFDIANSDTKNESSKLASSLIIAMRGRLPMVRNTHRRMSLQVLLSPDVPAVLVELAFLSNEKDEANLASPAWRRKATNAVADGIDAYFNANATRPTLTGGLPASGNVNP